MIDLLNLLWGALTGQFRSRVSLEAQSWFFAISYLLSRKPRPCAELQLGSTARLFCDIFDSLN